jgi:membrane protein
MSFKLKSYFHIILKTYKGWNADDPFRQSSVIAYYAIFSLPALLVVVINVAGFFFEREAVNGEIKRQIASSIGSDTAEQVSAIIVKASDIKAGLIPSIIAFFTIISGAIGVFIELQKTLDMIFDVREKEHLPFVRTLRSRVFSFGLVVSIGFMLLISMVVSTSMAALSHKLEAVFPKGITYLFYGLEFIFSLGVIVLLFALMFKFLPDIRIRWKNIWPGAILTGFLFMLGKYGLSIYFAKSQPGSVYGAAGSIILLMLWGSYSSMIVFFGAEFTKQFAAFRGQKINPNRNAETVRQDQFGHPMAIASQRRPIQLVREYADKKYDPVVRRELEAQEARLRHQTAEIQRRLNFAGIAYLAVNLADLLKSKKGGKLKLKSVKKKLFSKASTE